MVSGGLELDVLFFDVLENRFYVVTSDEVYHFFEEDEAGGWFLWMTKQV